MFADVRKRLLPSLIRDRFRVARSALDQKSFAGAEPQLAEARLMIVEAERLGVKDDGLADLSVLVDGFLQLIRSVGRATARAPAARRLPASGRDRRLGRLVRPSAPSPAAGTSCGRAIGGACRRALPRTPRTIYSVEDEGVAPPVAIEQRMPAMSIGNAGDHQGAEDQRRRSTS